MRFAISIALAAALFLPAFVEAHDQPKQKDNSAAKAVAVPCRLTDSGHILVRAKINGKGPFNFIIDTGAPLVYVATTVAEKLGIKADEKKPTALAEFEVEGGVVQK